MLHEELTSWLHLSVQVSLSLLARGRLFLGQHLIAVHPSHCGPTLIQSAAWWFLGIETRDAHDFLASGMKVLPMVQC